MHHDWSGFCGDVMLCEAGCGWTRGDGATSRKDTPEDLDQTWEHDQYPQAMTQGI